MMVVVVHDLGNWYHQTYASLADVVPLSQVKYKLISPYRRGILEDGFKEQGLKQIYLSAPRRGFVEYSLELQDLDPRDFIVVVTCHTEWKKTWWQGYIFSRKEWVIPTGQHIGTRSSDAYPLIKKILNTVMEKAEYSSGDQ
jgi:hypothetical protein